MGLETGDLFSSLNEAWPPGTDNRSEGDDHLRLIKHVLRYTFSDTTTTFTISKGGHTYTFDNTGIIQIDGISVATKQLPIAFPFSGKPLASATVIVPMVIPITVAANLASSAGYATTAATNSAVFNLYKVTSGGISTSLGTVTFAPATKTATFGGAGGSLVAGDNLSMIGPNPQDGTLADCGVTIMATRA